ncbi:hypothetical protein P152DRAFT_404602 [Eremomyces bilateralis CBS 781.70]|uniref:BTB domain-containing protein n=1 Tax=Eremomyces bilateralis CBS 781.70 TaxID=1392243 RepID=A0A6G1FT29_9PEZI|nr:uncharacterized protein P152DRAFT_404602 [Eremomyces bilateralis CBS 781.70]KAF1808842.1 hypothetical protein P152DRAFT_404602 [Eremomyces bilateralis CBS 781.70]
MDSRPPPFVSNHSNTPQNVAGSAQTPASGSSNNTYLMSASPVRPRRGSSDNGYKPKIITTVGARPACLVNASVTYVGTDQIYAFGGFDQYTDEVYNHVLKLDLATRQWSLVDNFGDIPGVRMGHTATLWQGDKLLVYGGENEHRLHLSDVIILDLKTLHWTQPELHGTAPRGRARHAAVIHDQKLWIMGGMSGQDSWVLDDICYLDLKTWTWSRAWRLVHRYDHTCWIWGGRIWVFGGINEDMERNSELWWLDLRGSVAFESQMSYGTLDRNGQPKRLGYAQQTQPTPGSTGYTANSSSVQVNSGINPRSLPLAPGSISSIKFVASPNLPSQTLGQHFHAYSSGCLLDFHTAASISNFTDTSLSALDLETLRWQRVADGRELFNMSYRWHYCAMNEDGTQAWLLGCPTEPNNPADEYLSDVLHIDLRKFGLFGNAMFESEKSVLPASDTHRFSHLSAIGTDLAKFFDLSPGTGSGTDFIITTELDEPSSSPSSPSSSPELTHASLNRPTPLSLSAAQSQTSPPIHVHKLILQARWPHFSRLYAAQMLEFHTKKMHIPEPYSAVRAFLLYLYTDSIAPPPGTAPSSRSSSSLNLPSPSTGRRQPAGASHNPSPASANDPPGPSLPDVAGMLVLASCYDMPRLRALCVHRLSREIDVQNAAVIWDRASVANEAWLRRRAAGFCMTHWGRVVRTAGFRQLGRRQVLELCGEVDSEGRVVGGEELERVGGLAGGRFGYGGTEKGGRERVRDVTSGEEEEGDGDEDGDGMDVEVG